MTEKGKTGTNTQTYTNYESLRVINQQRRIRSFYQIVAIWARKISRYKAINVPQTLE